MATNKDYRRISAVGGGSGGAHMLLDCCAVVESAAAPETRGKGGVRAGGMPPPPLVTWRSPSQSLSSTAGLSHTVGEGAVVGPVAEPVGNLLGRGLFCWLLVVLTEALENRLGGCARLVQARLGAQEDRHGAQGPSGRPSVVPHSQIVLISNNFPTKHLRASAGETLRVDGAHHHHMATQGQITSESIYTLRFVARNKQRPHYLYCPASTSHPPIAHPPIALCLLIN
ncbi:unnamed protein product [Pleuronectes platessa]|uniref:Uncharacterized protein n=1 Tax=Pleuronectes platessa TaxID=8262 RepID=A0A9N7V6V9_PLEPL|nr:unnamed protein product [Pleuronectes platessa]